MQLSEFVRTVGAESQYASLEVALVGALDAKALMGSHGYISLHQSSFCLRLPANEKFHRVQLGSSIKPWSVSRK